MPCCLLLIIAILGPRIGMILLWLFSNFYDKPFDGFLLPLLGFFFMPFTTLAYGWAINSAGSVSGFYLAVVIFAVLLDLGVIGGGARERKRSD